MTRATPLALTIALGLLPAAAGDDRLPKIDGVLAVAEINGEPLGLDEYLRALGQMHSDVAESGPTVPQRDPLALLQRLVQLKLILQEARTIGLDALPEFEASRRQFRDEALRAALFARVTRDLPPPSAAEIDALVRERTEEVEVALVLFADRAGALAFAARLAEGARFTELAPGLVAEKAARRYDEPRFLQRTSLFPAVATALAGLAPGQVSAPVELASGFVVVQVGATRVPESSEARAAAERELGSRARAAALRPYVERLREKRVRVDEELVASLDFDAQAEAFATFLADDRVVARIDGGDPVRVRDLARAIQSRTYHGVEQAAQKKRLGKARDEALEQLTTERVLRVEAERLKLDATPQFRKELAEFEHATLFGLFVQRVIDPSVEVTEDEIRAFYEAHLADYTEPEMVRLESLTFADPAAALHALERLNAGADLRWTRANAAGQVDPGAVPEELRYDNRLLSLASLPAGVRAALAGAGSGDYRLYAETPTRHHVLFVRDRVAAKPQALAQVHDDLARRVFGEEREVVLADWTRTMRERSAIRLFVDAEKLRGLAASSIESAGGE